jgi:hypothetical protein
MSCANPSQAEVALLGDNVFVKIETLRTGQHWNFVIACEIQDEQTGDELEFERSLAFASRGCK